MVLNVTSNPQAMEHGMSNDKDEPYNLIIIIILAVASILMLVATAFIFFYLLRRRRKRMRETGTSSSSKTTSRNSSSFSETQPFQKRINAKNKCESVNLHSAEKFVKNPKVTFSPNVSAKLMV